jgi:hypothetical protein
MIIIFVTYSLHPNIIRKNLRVKLSKFQLQPEKIIVVNNNISFDNFEDDDLFTCISGSNSFLDISGYYEGLISSELESNGNYLLINDTIFTSHYSNLYFSKIKSVDKFLGTISIPGISGLLANYKGIYFANPISNLNFYMPTFFLIINRKSVDIFIEIYNKFPELNLNIEPLSTFINLHLYEPGFSHNIVKKISNWDSSLIEKKRNAIFFESIYTGEIGKIGALIPLNSKLKDLVLFYLLDRLKKYDGYFSFNK